MSLHKEIAFEDEVCVWAAHTTMSQQALDSPKVREGLKDILLGPAQPDESLQKMKPGTPAALTTAGPRQ